MSTLKDTSVMLWMRDELARQHVGYGIHVNEQGRVLLKLPILNFKDKYGLKVFTNLFSYKYYRKHRDFVELTIGSKGSLFKVRAYWHDEKLWYRCYWGTEEVCECNTMESVIANYKTYENINTSLITIA